MKNDALLKRARRLDPVPEDAFENLARSTEAQEVLRGILGSSPSAPVRPPAPRRHAPVFRTMARRTIALAALVAVVIGVVLVQTPDDPRDGTGREWAPRLVRVAEASPRFLITQEGWTIASVFEFRSDYGEMMFQNGPNAMEAGAPPGVYWMDLHWIPTAEHQARVEDRKRGASDTWEVSIAGHEAILMRSAVSPPGLPRTLTAIWRDGAHSMELRSDVIPTVAEFKKVASTIEEVDVDTWLSAMPASVVKPGERKDEVDRILAELPVPANLDVETLEQSGMVLNDYALEDEVTNAVVCSWIQQWVDGTEAGDERAVKQAVHALSWKGWADHPFIRDVVHGMKTNTPVNGDRSVPIGVTYQRHMGCEEG